MQPKQKQVSINALSRRLANGNEYNALFPQPKNEKIKLKQGDTYTSIDLIIQWVLKHNHEVSKVATKLQQSSLEATCKSIHHFLYNHFQYKADGEAQLLRSPAYAWKTRFEGIDCKSYSIIASAILVQLGIKHYIRKIKQVGFSPDNFTHVYVVVPKNQKTASLNNGYYTIDGTLPTTTEPNFTDKKDFYMDKLPHYGLQGLRSNQVPPPPPPTGTTGGTQDTKGSIDWEKLKALINKIDFKNIFSVFGCLGNMAYDKNQFNGTSKAIDTYFGSLIYNINLAVANNDVEKLSFFDNEIRGNVHAADCAFRRKMEERWRNDCTVKHLQKTIEKQQHYVHIVANYYEEWIRTYYDIKDVGSKNFTSHGLEAEKGFYFSHTDNPCIIPTSIRQFTRKPNLIGDVKPFVFNEMVLKQGPGFNIKDYLNSITETLIVIKEVTGSNSNGGSSSDIYDINNPKDNTKNAGMGFLIGGLAFAGLAVWGFNKLKNKK